MTFTRSTLSYSSIILIYSSVKIRLHTRCTDRYTGCDRFSQLYCSSHSAVPRTVNRRAKRGGRLTRFASKPKGITFSTAQLIKDVCAFSTPNSKSIKHEKSVNAWRQKKIVFIIGTQYTAHSNSIKYKHIT